MSTPRMRTANPVLLSQDIPATVHFYTTKLGFICLHEHDGGAILKRDDTVLHFTHCPDRRFIEWSCCRVEVAGIDALYEEFAKQSVVHPSSKGRPHDTDWGTREFGVIDSQGVLITFYERQSAID